MATYNELAHQYAQNKKTEYENSLGYLTNDLATSNQASIDAINSQYNTLINSINNQKTDVVSAYEDSARQAYINKMLAGRQLDTTLSQLGINTQGMGVQHRLSNELAYGQNLATAMRTREEALGDIAERVTQTEGDRATALNQQAATYAEALAEANRYKQSLLDNRYNEEYARYLADLQYQDQLKQQEWERQMAEKNYNLNAYSTYNSGGSYSRSGSEYATGAVPYGQLASSTGDGQGNMIYTDTAGNVYKMKAGYNPYTGTYNNDVKNGTFSNGYQPNNINKVPLSSVKGKTIQYNGQEQKVWTTGGGNYYFWDGKQNKYIKMNDAEKKKLGLK